MVRPAYGFQKEKAFLSPLPLSFSPSFKSLNLWVERRADISKGKKLRRNCLHRHLWHIIEN